MKNTRLLGLSLAASCVALVGGCEQAPVETPDIVRPVRIVTIDSLEGGNVLQYPGEIQGVQNAELAFEVPGRLVQFPVQEGISVSEGQLLGQLDQTEFQASLDAAAAKYRSSKETFERFSEVFERGAISAQELDLRQRMFEVDSAQLDAAQKAFDDTQLTAPFAGRIGRTFVDNFTNVQAKQPILLLQDLTELEVVVNVPEQDWLRAKPGLTLAQQTERAQPVVGLSSIPGRTFPAVITEVSASADPVTRTFEARARFDPPGDLQVLPGMSASVAVTIPRNVEQGDIAFYLPANAVLGANDGSSYVWRVGADMTVSPAPVETGILSGAEIQIAGGLNEGDRVAVSGVQHLRDGMRVRELTD